MGAGGGRSGVTGGPDSRSAAKRGHNQSGIIGEHEPIARSGIVQCFAEGVFCKGRGIFLERWAGIEPRREVQFDLRSGGVGARVAREVAKLGKFSWIGGREIQLNGRAH